MIHIIGKSYEHYLLMSTISAENLTTYWSDTFVNQYLTLW